jgi:hypothetical protein
MTSPTVFLGARLNRVPRREAHAAGCSLPSPVAQGPGSWRWRCRRSTLGIGATAAAFSLVEGVLLTPLPHRDPERLVLVPSVPGDSRQAEHLEGMPTALWMDWQQHATSIEAIAAYGWTFNFVVDADAASRSRG